MRLKSKRNVNVECLRTFAMMGIVIGHCLLYAYDGAFNADFNLQGLMARGIASLIVISVNVLVLISGYFTFGSRGGQFLKVRKWFRLYLMMLFYSVLFLIIGRIQSRFAVDTHISHYFPIKSDVYWFMTDYLQLMLLSPFLIRIVSSISKGWFQLLLAILFFLNVVIQVRESEAGFSLLWFVFLFLFAGYWRTYELNLSKKIQIVAFFISWVGYYIVCTLKIPFINWLIGTGYNNIFVFVMAVCVLSFFIDRKSERVVASQAARLAPYTLGVYLIHEHPVVREILWSTVRDWYPMLNVGIVLFVSLGVFLVCVFIDWIRQCIFKILRIEKGIDVAVSCLKAKLVGNLSF